MNPTLGRIVIYKLTEEDKKAIQTLNRGNTPDELPAMVVAVWSETTINVQIFLDGPEGLLWKTSIMEGDQPGNWHWPKRD